MKNRITGLLAVVVVAAASVVGGAAPAHADVNVYTTEGTHHVNGRDWKTTCEKYSQTKRCRTMIKATQVSEVKGRFVATTGWVFNNLTYLPAPRELWRTNPLGGNGVVDAKLAWTAADGRKWSTECDTATTGSNGCRSYTESRVIEASRVNGRWTYRWVTKSVFNNIVMFSAPKPAAPVVVNIPDAGLRACINEELGRAPRAAITSADALKVTDLECDESGITHLTGLAYFTNVQKLWLDDNNVSDLSALKGLVQLRELTLAGNHIADIAPLQKLTRLQTLDLTSNAISNVAPLGQMTRLLNLYLVDNELTNVAPLAQLQNLSQLDLGLNWITDVRPIAKITNLVDLFLEGNEITDVASLGTMSHLSKLYLDGNHITDVAPLAKISSLRELGLADNDITKVAPLAKLVNLEFLDLSGNSVADPESLDPLVQRGCFVMFA